MAIELVEWGRDLTGMDFVTQGFSWLLSSRRVRKKKSNVLQVLKPAALTSSLGTGVHLRVRYRKGGPQEV